MVELGNLEHPHQLVVGGRELGRWLGMLKNGLKIFVSSSLFVIDTRVLSRQDIRKCWGQGMSIGMREYEQIFGFSDYIFTNVDKLYL